MDTQTQTDSSGSPIFCTGDMGAAHVMAHRMLDTEQYERGHRVLGAWLDRREGDDSDWVHIQWHMLVFELALGHWDTAYARFCEHILPAVDSGDAWTDGPAGLWRLALAADGARELPWEAVRDAAAACVSDTSCAFIHLHHLLAFCGAGDVDGIDAWFEQFSDSDETLLCAARGLRAVAVEDFRTAVRWLDIAIPALHELGGSRAQNELFTWIRDRATERVSTLD